MSQLLSMRTRFFSFLVKNKVPTQSWAYSKRNISYLDQHSVPRPKTASELVEFLNVKKKPLAESSNSETYEGKATDPGWGRLFGGQLLGQALAAAQKATKNSIAISLQCYFVRPGSVDHSIKYHVEKIRDGKSISLRQVRAIQRDKTIFILTGAFERPLSFTDHNTVLKHSEAMPETPDPCTLLNQTAYLDTVDDSKIPDFIRHLQTLHNPIEMRPSRHFHPCSPDAAPPDKNLMLRLKQPLCSTIVNGTDAALHQQRLLAYMSDYGLLSTSLQPHKTTIFDPILRSASLDHVIRFHQRFDDMDLAEEWLLHSTHSPVAARGRGFSNGVIYRHATGQLLATTSQEGITRIVEPAISH